MRARYVKLRPNRYNSFVVRNHSSDCVRVRFAPSPTGQLHLGGLRTALYNYLFAKKHKGAFILRIEDTDRKRMVASTAENIQNDLQWAGIDVDEGPKQGGCYGPYVQSERLSIYQEHVQLLLKNGSAYYCFCSDRRLQLLRRQAVSSQEIPKYDNRCRHLRENDRRARLAKGEQYCVRFKICDQEETFNDLVYGSISYNIAKNEGDPVIIKSDGYPTYHYANVVDDHLMRISHVLRGVEWQISTTKHILLYRAFGWTPPLFGHLPLLLNADGTKLSKRQGGVNITDYRNDCIYPLALINFIVSCGGGFSKDQERFLKPRCYSFKELCGQFDVSKINPSSGKLMPERLLEFNRMELRKRFENCDTRELLIETVKRLVKNKFPSDTLDLSDVHIENILKLALNRIDKLSDLVANKMKFLWMSPAMGPLNQELDTVLEHLRITLLGEENLTKDSVSILLKNFSNKHSLNYGSFMKDLRTILSGLTEGPSVAEIVEILGKVNTIRRLDNYINKK
ncbi:probable glutamate--tRNA ligase, mitochondrial [Cylas formicarius]|uniref:probable glutamate--tRNA ligase, mitochondrial n=1 Tax=Cylas formicarius TaxID=197179 RepID=UPI00295884C2|nr:probable glutamate--tRNA ligase, mitochondrial [Cylas formicarius]